VLEVCASLGLAAAIAPVTRAELEDADEVFLTSTAGGVMPITRVMGRILGNDRPGPVFARVHDTYWDWHKDARFRTEVRPLA
jgi:branched-chain amino acid aminotransferase